MKGRKSSKYNNRSSRVFAPVHINSKGVIDYKLPLCDLMDRILSKKRFNTSVITETLDGNQYYYDYNLDGKDINYTKYSVNNSKLDEIEKAIGNRLVKESSDHNNIIFSLYDDNTRIKDIVAYSSKFLY
ncbi:hypothetical protein [Clostridium perfringens]|uniref:hypothetical protein n=1 Tax=Clostridium perfringens TaxID=1502 RepID=UPI0039E825FF